MIAFPKLFPAGQSYVRIPSSRAACMRILLEIVERGSCYWASGTVSPDKATALAEKFALLYGTDVGASRRSALRARHRAASQVLFWPRSPTCLEWWLLVSEGDGVVHEREKLKNAGRTGERLTFLDQFRLVRRQREREKGGGRRWTWVLAPEAFERHLHTVRELSRSHGSDSRITDRLDRYLNQLRALPGFAGIREQKKELQRAGREAWQRTHREPATYPWGERIPYLSKAFACYHRPEALKLDVLAAVMCREAQKESVADQELAQALLEVECGSLGLRNEDH